MIFVDNSKKCQIDCSILLSYPNISHGQEQKYEIARMEIYFVSSSYNFLRGKACGDYNNIHFNITIGCAGEYFHGKIV